MAVKSGRKADADAAKASKSAPEPKKPTLTELLAKQDPAKLQGLAMMLAEAAQESQALIADVMGRAPGMVGAAAPNGAPDPFGAMTSFAKLGQALAARPDKLAKANTDLYLGWMDLWREMAVGQFAAPARDRRFADPEWSANPAFAFMRRSYELNTRWIMSLIDGAEGMAEEDRRKARFFARQTADAFSPTNFFATNPEALKVMLETGGTSVLEGLKQARQDIKRGGGKLMISQVDEKPFKLGENIATAPGEVVFRNDLIELIQYAPTRKKAYDRPLLIFPPWINKFYILDLREENSMIRWLVSKGLTVLVVSWRSADDVTKDFTWDDYITHGIHAAVDATLEATGAERLNTVGYCIGGTLLSGALAKMAQDGDDRITSATFFASQADFELAGDLLVFTDPKAQTYIDGVIDENKGVMPGEAMGETFNWLRPVDLVWRYIVDNYMLGRKPRPFDLLYWNADQTNIPGDTHRTYIKELYSENKLATGRFDVLGQTVSLKDVTIPVFVQAGRDDHICPYNSVYRTAKAYGGEATFCLAGSGHIAGVINHPDQKKYQHWVNEQLPRTGEAWLEGAEEIPGSWWPTWWTWLKDKSGVKRNAVSPADKGLGAAPGKYVKARLSDLRAQRGLD